VRATADHHGEPIGRPNDPNIYRVGLYRLKGKSAARNVLLVTSGLGNQAAGAVAAADREERGDVHSITSSASASNVGGTSRPSDLSVLRLSTSSNFVGCWNGSFGVALDGRHGFATAAAVACGL
jgi:hypothetical protein